MTVKKDKLVELLKHISAYFNSHDIFYFIAFGTLLGVVRDYDIIHDDEDLDFFVLKDYLDDFDWEDFHDYLLSVYPFSRVHFDKIYFSPFRIFYSVFVDDVHADFFELIPVGPYFLYYTKPVMIVQTIIANFIKKHDKKKYLHVAYGGKNNPVMNFCRLLFLTFSIPRKKFLCRCRFILYRFHGCEIKVPLMFEEWLNLIYGKDWRIPKPDWSDSKERICNLKVRKLKV